MLINISMFSEADLITTTHNWTQHCLISIKPTSTGPKCIHLPVPEQRSVTSATFELEKYPACIFTLETDLFTFQLTTFLKMTVELNRNIPSHSFTADFPLRLQHTAHREHDNLRRHNRLWIVMTLSKVAVVHYDRACSDQSECLNKVLHMLHLFPMSSIFFFSTSTLICWHSPYWSWWLTDFQ